MRPCQLETADLYDERLTADLATMRLLVDHSLRRMFARNFTAPGPLRVAQVVGPAPVGDGDLKAITGFNFRQALLRYLVDTGRLILDGENIQMAAGLAVSATEDEQARKSTTDPRFAEIAEVLAAFETHSQRLLQGEDSTKILQQQFGFKRLQSIWERQALQMPQRVVERTLAARMLLDRMRQQPSGMTVLEGGAGIGAILRRALELPEFIERLSALDQYIYTDISPFLIEWAKDWFRRNAPAQLVSKMKFLVLDLDAVQGANGCAAQSVDLVLLDDVAHDVIDLHRTLTQLRGVLRSNGWLGLTENFRQAPRDFLYVEIFPMMLHGYNKARLDPGRRDQYGFMTLEQWRRSLGDAGFSDVHVYPDPAHHLRWPNGGIVAAGPGG